MFNVYKKLMETIVSEDKEQNVGLDLKMPILPLHFLGRLTVRISSLPKLPKEEGGELTNSLG